MAIEPMLDESKECNKQLVAAIKVDYSGASWQHCKIHFMRNILVNVPHRKKDRFCRNAQRDLESE